MTGSCLIFIFLVFSCFVMVLILFCSGKPFKLPPELKTLLTKQKKRKRDNGAHRFGALQLPSLVEFCGKDGIY